MTRTEERLTDALRAAARHGQDLTLRPLTVPERPRPRLARWLAPVAAAAAVALIVTGALALTGGRHVPPDNYSPDNSPPAAGPPPRYYVEAEQALIVVRATATGTVTDRIHFPQITVPGKTVITYPGASLAAGGSGGSREFIVGYAFEIQSGNNPTSSGQSVRTMLYSFSLTATGRVTGYHPVTGGTFTGLAESPALSPDGSKVAVTVTACCGAPDQILVIDLRTGSHTTWQGGMQRRGFDFTLQALSWNGNASLVFLADWCRTQLNHPGICLPEWPGDDQVRTLDLAAGGGSLAGGRVLFHSSARYQHITQVLMSPGGTAMTIEVIVQLRHSRRVVPWDFQVSYVPLTGGGSPRLLYQGSLWAADSARLAADASGRDLLIIAQTAHGNGWLDNGKLRQLPLQWGAVFCAAW